MLVLSAPLFCIPYRYHFMNAPIAIYAIMFTVNSKHIKTLEAIFANPVNENLQWRKIEALLLASGAEKSEGQGSRVTFFLNGKRAEFNRPHPHKEALRYRVKDVRAFLQNAGVTP